MKLIVPRISGRMIVYAMKWTATLIAIICSSTLVAVATSASAQSVLDKKISISIKDEGLKAALDKIARTATVKILYSGNIARSDAKVTLHVNSVKLSRVLEQALTNLPYSYSAVDNDVLIRYDQDKLKREQQEQQKKTVLPVRGKVTDSKGMPLIGATVRIKGSDKITSTDAQGIFHLMNLDNAPVIVISYVGYLTKEVKLEGDLSNLVIILEEDAAALKEVTVSTGYQTIPLERVTGSFSKVDNALYNRQVSTDVISRLKDIAPGLLFDQRSDQNRLSIRGRSTIFANDQPLIVVDNFPYDGDINNINPNDVENISILKDAAAASIWGVKAGNGVIVITTKKGKLRQAPTVELNTNITVGKKPDLFYKKQIATSDYINVEQFLFSNGYYDADIDNSNGLNAPTSPVVDLLAQARSGQITQADAGKQIDNLRSLDIRKDLLKYFYRETVNQQYALNIRGGTDNYTYYLSGGFDKNLNNTKGNGYDRISFKTEHRFNITKNLEAGASINYAQSNTDINSAGQYIYTGGPYGRLAYPYARLADDDGNPLPMLKDYSNSFKQAAIVQGLLNWDYVPLNEQKLWNEDSRTNDVRLNADIKYTLFSGLSFQSRYQYETQQINYRNLQNEDSYYVRDLYNNFTQVNGTTLTHPVPAGDIYDQSRTVLNSHNFRTQLNFNKDWNDNSLVALAGFEVRQAIVSGTTNRYYGYDGNIGATMPVNYSDGFVLYDYNYANIPNIDRITGTTDRYRSYFANAAYTFKNKYTLSSSGRIDQSNLFGVNTNQKQVPLWSAGLKWDINKENFYKLEWLPVLNLRATYGYSGNIDRNVTAYTTAYYATSIYSKANSASINRPPNPNLRWERSAMLNFGLDFATKDNRISGSIEVYKKKGTDLIGDGQLDPTVGLASFRGNVAAMKGKGVDVQVNSININSSFKWQTTLLFSYTQDEITRYDIKNTTGTYFADGSLNNETTLFSPTVGKPLFGVYAWHWAGLDPATGDPRGYVNGNASTDYNTIFSQPFDSLAYKGRATPSTYGALRNTFSYKQWSLSFNISYRFGYYFHRQSINYGDLFTRGNGHSDYALRWQKPGDEQKTNIPSMLYPADPARDSFFATSETLVEKGDNIRFQDLSLSYTYSNTKKKRLPFHAMTLYLYANNIGILWRANKSGIDPDAGTYPLPFTFSCGLKTNF